MLAASLRVDEIKLWTNQSLVIVCTQASWLPPIQNASLKVAVKNNNEKYETGQLLMRRMLRLFYQEERSVFQN